MFVGQLDQLCSQQMPVFTTLINTGSWRNWEMGKGLEKDLPKENLFTCALCESCEAVGKAVGPTDSHSLSRDEWDPKGSFAT